jgi:LPS export ABC transporter permease LptG/LPS export ABC transporter permease LptF
VLTGEQVLVERLMHVPQQRNARHNGSNQYMSLIDRYVMRQVLLPFLLGLLVFTFIFIIPPLLQYGEGLVAKGVSGTLIAGLISLLVPQALAVTIPMSLLLALLIAFGRLSADREFVAMQACGVSLRRLLWPVALVAITAWAMTSYVLIALVPDSNQRFLETVFTVASQRAEGEVKPRTFYQDFPNFVLYVRDIPPDGRGWNGVFLADLSGGQRSAIYLARHGRVVIDKERKRIDIELLDATQHSLDAEGNYTVNRFTRGAFNVDPAATFSSAVAKGPRQMSIAELRAEIDRRRQQVDPATNGPFSTHNEEMEIHKRFSIPVACLVFGLIGLALGATHRRGGALGSFVIGIAVVFAYYVPLMIGPSLVKGRYLTPWLGQWLPNIVLGALGILMFAWRDRLADQPFRLHVPGWLRSIRIKRGRGVPGLSILDGYITRAYLQYVLLSATTLLGIFYIASFLDISDKLFKGMVTTVTIAEYFRYATPQWVYYVLPLSILLGTLVTIAVLTKNSELIVMKACGISLYRLALPIFAMGLLTGAGLVVLQETTLGPSTRRAEELKEVIRGGNPQQLNLLANRWLVGSAGQIYHYQTLDPRTRELNGLDVYEFTPGMERLVRQSYFQSATFAGGEDTNVWHIRHGWTREFDTGGDVKPETPIATERRMLERADFFGTEEPNPDYMGYRQLRAYTERLRAGGFDVTEQDVALWRKAAFPFVPLIMTLLAVPFAATIGRSGAMGGIGVGIALAISYWTLISIFAALGTGGALPPMLAAWAPNFIFGAGALYLLLTART